MIPANTLSQPFERLPEAVWSARQSAHTERLTPFLKAQLNRRKQRTKDPVMDFLFEYYTFRPRRLLAWTPGVGVVLEGEAARTFLTRKGFEECDGGVCVDPSQLSANRQRGARWIRSLLLNTQQREPFLGCSGMHEWAMVYRSDAPRHNQVPLRMDPEALAEFVESRPIRCSHHDAFRFFTPAAKPLNHLQPTADLMLELEQPGCIHVNMDIYRWAFKLFPWVPSEILADAFEFAHDARTIDMRASPYDLKDAGLEPILIETTQGRAEYQELQRELYERGLPLRQRLIEASARLVELMV